MRWPESSPRPTDVLILFDVKTGLALGQGQSRLVMAWLILRSRLAQNRQAVLNTGRARCAFRKDPFPVFARVEPLPMTSHRPILARFNPPAPRRALSWSHDGRFILFTEDGSLFVLPILGERKPVLVSRIAVFGEFSPDTRWIAYTWGESGRGFRLALSPPHEQ